MDCRENCMKDMESLFSLAFRQILCYSICQKGTALHMQVVKLLPAS